PSHVRAEGGACGGGGRPARVGREQGFFFSSRRRHTTLQGDWSSDVCSSDLVDRAHPTSSFVIPGLSSDQRRIEAVGPEGGDEARSEERRVGKECRSTRAAARSKRREPSRRHGAVETATAERCRLSARAF